MIGPSFRRARSLAIALMLAAAPLPSLAWGGTGHTIINRLAAENLPSSVPSFLRDANGVNELAYLGPEEDRIKGAGTSWDDDNDEGHFLDVNDDLTVAGVVKLTALPESMNAYAQALDAAKTTPYKEGFLPYAMIDGFERVRKDLAYWRVADYMATRATTDAAKAQFAAERTLREQLTLRDIGDWGHFVADGCQPLHLTIHFNGWGDYPNPKGYSTSHHLHSMFESEFVDAHVTVDDVRKHIAPYAAVAQRKELSQSDIASIVGGYLTASALAVPQLYDIDKAGGFSQATPAAVDFTATQLGRGATMLRDLIALAWEDSINMSVDYPPVSVRDVLAGKVVPTGKN